MMISVIICTYNGADSIRGCLNSLRELDYPLDEFEVIIVDDGSTDETPKIISEYPFRVIRHKENRMLAAARNSGIRGARGAIIVFTDDDCVVPPNWLKNLVGPLLINRKLGGVGGIDELPKYVKSAPRIIKEVSPYMSQFKGKNIISPGGYNCAYRKKVLEEVGLFDESLITCEDKDINYRILSKGYKFFFEPKAIVYHNPRLTIKKYYRQMYRYGIGSYQFHKKHGLIPPLWILLPFFCFVLTIFSVPLSLLNPYFIGVLVVSLAIPILVSCYWALIRTNKRNFPLALIILIIQYTSYMSGFTRGLLYKTDTDYLRRIK